jgi:glucose-6-phosphate 1-dehydrogenase
MASAAALNVEDDVELAESPAGPCVMVVFGAAGDLTTRKLIPALYNLAKAKLLPANFAVLGVSVDDLNDDQFRIEATRFLDKEDHTAQTWSWFNERLCYLKGDFADPNTFASVSARLSDLDRDYGTEGNYLFYLATAPKFFAEIVQQLGGHGLAKQERGNWRRVVIEKPFGHDLESAKALNAAVQSVLSESQIYRIDHYLGKETVQNLLVFRFSNSIFEPIWNQRFIDHVQITNAETVGVERRGGYFDNVGTMRDMIPNHVMQLISLTAMEPPASFSSDAVHDEQAKVLHGLQP